MLLGDVPPEGFGASRLVENLAVKVAARVVVPEPLVRDSLLLGVTLLVLDPLMDGELSAEDDVLLLDAELGLALLGPLHDLNSLRSAVFWVRVLVDGQHLGEDEEVRGASEGVCEGSDRFEEH